MEWPSVVPRREQREFQVGSLLPVGQVEFKSLPPTAPALGVAVGMPITVLQPQGQ